MQRQHEKLVVWQEAHKLCIAIYAMTKSLPQDEKFGLISQMRRAAYSVPMNLAEGNARHSQKEKVHFFDIANASLEELHYQATLALDLKYISAALFKNIDDHIQRIGFLFFKLRSSLV